MTAFSHSHLADMRWARFVHCAFSQFNCEAAWLLGCLAAATAHKLFRSHTNLIYWKWALSHGEAGQAAHDFWRQLATYFYVHNMNFIYSLNV